MCIKNALTALLSWGWFLAFVVLTKHLLLLSHGFLRVRDCGPLNLGGIDDAPNSKHHMPVGSKWAKEKIRVFHFRD